MNIQFKKGVLELCVLVLVSQRDYYGYDLVREISSRIAISEGAVYPLLRKLTKEGYFTTYLQESSKGPSRKYYQMTEDGINYLDELKNEWSNFSSAVNNLIRSEQENE